MLRAPIWIMSAYFSTSSSDSWSSASVTMRSPKRSRISAMICRAVFAHALEGIWRGARLVRAAAEELCAGLRHLFGHRKRLLAAFNRARAGDDGQIVPPMAAFVPGKRMTVSSSFTSRLTSLYGLETLMTSATPDISSSVS